jgi:uncharacterized protein YyaL (SSP411 family)
VNRLSSETSPYLLQHRDNPVDWYPWGEEAFARARERDVPIFLSIGYSACHWCHVMAHESFEDGATAAILNDRFVAVKVDREERPDVDAIYMEAAQVLTGSGGWPLSVFIAPDGRPFFAGTYFPKQQMGRTPSFTALLDAVFAAWSTGRDAILAQADELTGAVASRLAALPPADQRTPASELLAGFLTRFTELFDPKFGGIGTAPKFPQSPMLDLLLRASVNGSDGAGSMLEVTLAHLASGGIYDHLGGGFCRYSVDRTWTVPHFEKMLYDQAGLARVFTHAYAATNDPRWRQVATETLDYVVRDLVLPGGGIASAEDADSEGEEGRFYVWSPEEVDAILGPTVGPLARAHYGIEGDPNFEGRFIPLRRPVGDIARSSVIEAARVALLEVREQRVRPGLDDKILTEWNGMAIAALCEAAGAFGEARFLEAAAGAGRFLLDNLRRPDGRWLRSHKDGRSQHLGLLADHAWVIDAFTRLFEATGDGSWLVEASTTAEACIGLFGAPDGGFFSTGDDAEQLVVRPRDHYDGVIPAGSSVAAEALLRLGTITGDRTLIGRVDQAVAAVEAAAAAGPMALPHLIGVAWTLESGPLEIVVTGGRRDLVDVARRRYLPGAVIVWGEERGPLFAGRTGELAYVCVGGTCQQPVGDAASLEIAIDDALATVER